jgi:undecaprenyl-diphosphatase
MEFSVWDSVVLALIQGFTEFLPVSSSGHLALARWWFGVSEVDAAALDAFLHVGTLGAVIWYYRQRFLALVQSVWQPHRRAERLVMYQLVVATVPAAVAGYMFQDFFETTWRTPRAVALGFMGSALLLLMAEYWSMRATTRLAITWRDAWWIGVAQILALIPSVSRSGATLFGGMARGVDREKVVEFSFLMSAPIIAAASMQGLWRLMQSGAIPLGSLILVALVSGISGVAGIALMLRVIRQYRLWPFAAYLLVLAAVLWYAA